MALKSLTFVCFGILAAGPLCFGVSKGHTEYLGNAKFVPYSAAGDPSGAETGETRLEIRPLIIDGKRKDWTTGNLHDVTDRSFVVRRALRINDALPGEKSEHWVWQRGPWLLVDRTKGSSIALRLPEYDPSVSRVVWFRDFAAYCGLSQSGRQLYAVVAQIAARRPLLSKKLSPWVPSNGQPPPCAPAIWQREPLQVTFQKTGDAAVSYNLVGLSAVLVEDDDTTDETSTASQ